MKGNTYRRPCPVGYVRVVRSFENSDQDRFVSYHDANIMLGAGRLRRARLGPDYPNSYVEVKDGYLKRTA